jgi:hypothetical protein
MKMGAENSAHLAGRRGGGTSARAQWRSTEPTGGITRTGCVYPVSIVAMTGGGRPEEVS